WQREEPDPARDRLCTGSRGSMQHDCRIEGADFTPQPAPPRNEIVIFAYNVERGLRMDDQLRAFSDDAGVPVPDVLLISEADRGCTRSDNRNVARDYARALGMYYVYGVEFVELPRFFGPGGTVRRPCEHGNAIVSRYPLGNVRLIRHHHARSWDSTVQRVLRVGQPRLGGRVALTADIRIGERMLRVYSVHFESGHRGSGPRGPDAYREAQARELIDDASGLNQGVVIGGDMNVGRYLGFRGADGSREPTIGALVDAGYEDAHASLPRSERVTTDSGVAIDLILGRGVRFAESGVGPHGVWGALSDHLPVWTRLGL
ncbi:MAG: endonuclease/exonuclease/phosphatase family protein, partial [Chloroflexi bacterium]|nr:endonuclease/exonuclease/phosphatase family protein [Chloroflexota bacterium]